MLLVPGAERGCAGGHYATQAIITTVFGATWVPAGGFSEMIGEFVAARRLDAQPGARERGDPGVARLTDHVRHGDGLRSGRDEELHRRALRHHGPGGRVGAMTLPAGDGVAVLADDRRLEPGLGVCSTRLPGPGRSTAGTVTCGACRDAERDVRPPLHLRRSGRASWPAPFRRLRRRRRVHAHDLDAERREGRLRLAGTVSPTTFGSVTRLFATVRVTVLPFVSRCRPAGLWFTTCPGRHRRRLRRTRFTLKPTWTRRASATAKVGLPVVTSGTVSLAGVRRPSTALRS